MKRFKAILFLAALGAFGAAYDVALAENLSELAFFHRCYAHLTQQRPQPSNTLLAEVKAGTKSALQACTEVLDRARFTADSGTKIADDTDAVAKAALYSMHQLHRSWQRDLAIFDPIVNNEIIATNAWYEDNPLGAYITRALFSPGSDVRTVVQGSDFLQPVRLTMSPPASFGGVPSTVVGAETEFSLGAQQPFAPRSQLLGIRSVSIAPINFFLPVRFTNLAAMPDFANIGVSPRATQAIANVNFADITAVRGPLAETEQFAIQIRGNLQIASAGSYRLFLNVDDAGDLYIDQSMVINRTATGEGFVDLSLTAGSHALEIQYRQRLTTARLIMNWQGPGFTKQVVPASALSGLQADYYIESQPPPIRLTGNNGGGFMGNHNYFLTTFQEADRNFVPNGQERTNRSWARGVLNDALCRDVPVVRETDVTEFVIPASIVPFRQAAACVSCHATLDRQASLIRGLRWNPLLTIGNTSPVPDQFGILGVNMLAPSLPSLTTWTDTIDSLYGKRQPYGHFFFRNYRGELIDRIVNSLDELGTAITDQDDYYTCFAKRYYRYFLGIEVELGDPGNQLYPLLNGADNYHRSKVIELGMALKTHGSLRQLILDILAGSEYRMSDFGISYQGTNP